MCGDPSLLNSTRNIALASVAVPTVERGLPPIRSWSTMIAVVSPSRTSTSGRASVGIKPCTKAPYVSLISRCDSAAIVSNTSELLPEPETPVNTVSRRFGISTLTSLRLFTRAPCTRIKSWLSAACRASECVSVFVAMLIQELGSAHRFLHERADLCFFGCGQLHQREGGRPHGAFVDVRLVAEAERRVPRFELLRALEEADDLAVLCIGGHPVPGFRREDRRAGFDDRMEPLGHGAIRSLHLSDLREQGSFPIRLFSFRLQLLGALLHRGSFLGRESLGCFAGGSLSGLLRALLCRFPLSHCEPPVRPVAAGVVRRSGRSRPSRPPRRRIAWSCRALPLWRSASSASASSGRRDPRTPASAGGSGTSARAARARRPRETRPRRRRRRCGSGTCRPGGRPSPRRPCRRPTIPGSASGRSRRRRRAGAVRRRSARRGSRARSGW